MCSEQRCTYVKAHPDFSQLGVWITVDSLLLFPFPYWKPITKQGHKNFWLPIFKRDKVSPDKLYPQINIEYSILWESSLPTNISLEISLENKMILYLQSLTF